MDFEMLLERYKKFEAYEKQKYCNDTSENQELAMLGMIKLVRQLNEAWERLTKDQQKKYESRVMS